MASAPFPSLWSSNADLTGNSAFLFDPATSSVWLVGESSASGAALFQSTQLGISFTQVATIPPVAGVTVAFDPAAALDSSGNVHFIGQQQLPGGSVQLAKYTWTPGVAMYSGVLAGPFLLSVDGLIGADYDIVALSNGNCYVVLCLVTAGEETLIGLEVAPDGSIVSTDPLVTEAFPAGLRYGAVSLYSPDGISVEIYLHQHPKKVTFGDYTLTFAMLVRTEGSFSAQTTLFSFPARHVDNRLTVIGSGASRYLIECYYTQVRGVMAGNILLAALLAGVWSYSQVTGTQTASLVEPTLSLSSNGLVLGYLTKNFAVSFGDGPISLWDVDPATFLLTPRVDFPYASSATFMRGTKSTLPVNMPWGLVAQQSVGTALFYTGYNAPPTIELSPDLISPAVLGVTYSFDASGTYSPNLDVLIFSWPLPDDPTGAAVFVPDGAKATLMVPKSVGPDPFTVTVTVTVEATDVNGKVLWAGPGPPAMEQSALVEYPAVAPPVILALPPQSVPRNSQWTFTPTIAYGTGALSHYWVQLSGTSLYMSSRPTSVTLIFETQGALVGGEAVVFQLEVSDGINLPVYGTFEFDVAARVSPLNPTGALTRSTWAGTLSGRNQILGWGAPVENPWITNFFSAKRAALVGGGTVYCLIGAASVVVFGSANYTVLLPNVEDTILDAIHSDLDQTVVLTGSGLLQQFLPSPVGATDNATATINVATLGEGTFTALEATPPFAGIRVLTLSGPTGVLMLEVATASFTVVGVLKLAQSSGLLYGSDDVTYVRTSDVESLRSGQVLIGTVTQAGAPFETLINLATRSIVNTFDVTDLASARVTTGERLFAPPDSYAGSPMAPVLASPVTVASGQGTLSWQQSRPDLVEGYSIYVSSTYSGAPANSILTLAATVSSGMSRSVQVPGLTAGVSYAFQVQAVSLDGPSPLSNTVTVSL